ncbi:hypothetical protein SEPCBS57363_000440 [Sporothrix epigloea]|uniref:Ubiquitin-conjugating enzyme n=1 Tax=Sporothrix epigloea TaxID=1892477 RepID=A0ABP0D780_9PEZI
MSTSSSPAPFRLKSQASKASGPTSEDDVAFSASEASYASDQATSSVASSRPGRRRRIPRKGTTFLFAHPAPKLSTRNHLLKHVRPTLLMQLQQISPDRRPIPVIDVYPSSLIAGNVVAPRFSKRVPRLFGINGELGTHDTILVRSEDYDTGLFGSESDGDDEVLEHRALLAVLSPLRRGGQSEIALEDGSVWTMTALPTGSFDFVRIDEHGVKCTARWVRRSTTKPATGGLSSVDSIAPASDCRFTFSIIDTQSRRHPVLATMTRSTLEILDRYTIISSSASRYPPSRARTRSPVANERTANDDKNIYYDEGTGQPTISSATKPPSTKAQTTVPIEAALKKFISVSAILVSIQCGWSQSQTASHCPTTSNTSGSTRVSINGTGDERYALDQLAAGAANAGDDTSCRGRRLSARRKTRSATIPSADSPSRDWSPSITSKSLTRTQEPPKAFSTGAAYIQHRKQKQLSDSSDPESPLGSVANYRRSRAFSRLSGDFTAMVSSKFPQSPSPSKVPTTPVAETSLVTSLEQAPAAPKRATTAKSVTSAVSARPEPLGRQSWATQSLSRGGRCVSAYYATDSLIGQHVGSLDATLQPQHRRRTVVANEKIDGVSSGMDLDNMAWQLRPRSVVDKGSNPGVKWKRLGNWFKRLSGNGNNNNTLSTVGH